MKTVDEIEQIAWKHEREEVIEANARFSKQAVKDEKTIAMLVAFVEDIQYVIGGMPTFMRIMEKIMHYSDESEELQKFLQKYKRENDGTDR